MGPFKSNHNLFSIWKYHFFLFFALICRPKKEYLHYYLFPIELAWSIFISGASFSEQIEFWKCDSLLTATYAKKMGS